MWLLIPMFSQWQYHFILVFTPLPNAAGLGGGGLRVTTNFTLSQEQILAAKVENRKEKEKEHQMDHEQMSAEDEALKRMLDLEDMDEDNETEEEEEEEEVGTVKKKKRKKKIAVQDEDSNDVPDEEEVEEEIEEEIEEKEDEDEMINRRAEKILQGNNSL